VNEAIKKIKKYEKVDGPTFIQSSYERDYI